VGKVQNDRSQKAQLDAELRALALLGSAPVLFGSLHALRADRRYSPPDRRAQWALLDPNDLSDPRSGPIVSPGVKAVADRYPVQYAKPEFNA
jgi:hypothetical protein